MKLRTTLKRGVLVGSGLLVLGSLALGGSAFAATAQTTETTLAVTGGGDTVSILGLPTDLGGSVTPADGYKDQYYMPDGLGTSSSADDIFQIDDATGTGDGWTLSIQATPLTEMPPSAAGFASGTSAIVLPDWALQIDEPTAIVGESSQPSAEDPSITSLSNGYANFADSIPVTLATAAAGTGQGTWGVRYGSSDTMFQFNVPNNRKTVDLINFPTQATPYSSTITLTMVENT